MLGQEDRDLLAGGGGGGGNRKSYLRSVSWTDRSPTRPNSNKPLPSGSGGGGKSRPCLPPLRPLNITRPDVAQWPKAGSDDLGVWPNPQTPRGGIKNVDLNQGVREFEFKKDKLAFFDKECSRIVDHVYLGSESVAKNREVLRQNGITHVLNCVGFVCPEYFKGDLAYKTLWLQDSPSEDITSILYDVFDYFEDVREQGGRVFVHCCQGVSRSTSLVIAYLMWRERQSFEDAFQSVKAARGVTNPNMGFACQLLQCQKRVHAMPASPNSVLRMYRMAPHSAYDPLHLVPKFVSEPSTRGLDSRGAFVVHVPSAIFVWEGKNCSSVMANSARVAANQVVRYERARGPIVSVKEDEEQTEFWDALACGQASSVNDTAVTSHAGLVERSVHEYDLDFELFHKALAGGVVPPISVSTTELETRVPARESGWCKLRKKFLTGKMKEFLTSSKLNHGIVQSTSETDMEIDTCMQKTKQNDSSKSLPTTLFADSFDSPGSDCSLSADCTSDSTANIGKEAEHSVVLADLPLLPPSPCGSQDSYSYLPVSSPNLYCKSPTLSPSNSDYSASSFTFSPSSSNWSDLSSRQPSPSGLEAIDPFWINSSVSVDKFFFSCKETSPSSLKVVSPNCASRKENECVPCKGSPNSIAKRRGSNSPPRMQLPTANEPSQVPRSLVRSWSFALDDLEDEIMKDSGTELSEKDSVYDEQMLDSDTSGLVGDNDSPREVKNSRSSDDKTEEIAEPISPILYQWPTLNKVKINSFRLLDSRSLYVLVVPGVSMHSKNPGVVYAWLGQELLHENKEDNSVQRGSVFSDSYLQWEGTVKTFLRENCLPSSATLQLVKEGEEPEEFLKLINSSSLQNIEGGG